MSAADTLAEWVHNQRVSDTWSMLDCLGEGYLAACGEYVAARTRHDHPAAADALTEMRELGELVGVCQDHLRRVSAHRPARPW
jgi:hypothetical protein